MSYRRDGVVKGWKPPGDWEVIDTIEAHTAGEPLRIITGGLPEIPGRTILEKRTDGIVSSPLLPGGC